MNTAQTTFNLVDAINKAYNLPESAYAWVIFAGAVLCIIIPYLLGSINPAVLISKIFFHEDIRNFGSGNAGTTNMLRTYGKGAAAATFGFDLGKAALSFFLGMLIWSYPGAAIAGFFVVFGHLFPIFAHFKGGKGVACLAMIALLSSPLTFVALLAIYIIVVVGTRFISFASIVSAILYPLILKAFAGDRPLYVAMAVLSACFVVFMHRANIRRLMDGKESKVSFSKTSKKRIGEDDNAKGAGK